MKFKRTGVSIAVVAAACLAAGCSSRGKTRGRAMSVRRWLASWPVYGQLTGTDRLGLGAAVKSRQTAQPNPPAVCMVQR